MNPIVLDIESSGLDKTRCGIWQIAAIDLNTMEEFIEESRIDDKDIVEEGALKVIGKTEEDLRNPSKRSQKELLELFFNWMANREVRNVLCQNPQFDVSFIEIKAKEYGLKKTLQHRSFDLHSISQTIFFEKNGKFHFKVNKEKQKFESDMDLGNILEFCGIEDKRIRVYSGEETKAGEPHNALEDCKLTGECFSRLLFGKNIFDKFSEFEIPEVLKR